MTIPPRLRIDAIFTGFAPSGTTMVHLAPKCCAAKAIDCPWLPELAVTNPRARSSSDVRETRLIPPRILKAPSICKFSCLTQTSAFSESHKPGTRRNGVRWTCGAMARRAS